MKIDNLIPPFLVKRCPKSGRIVRFRFDNIYAKLVFPIIGILAIIWFLIRVIPKPSRLTYPCQQIAAGIGGTFLIYIIGILSSFSIYEFIRKRLNKPVALIFIAFAALIISVTFVAANSSFYEFKPNLTTPDGPNNPMGEAKGMFPGRVAWTQDFNATSWDEKTGNWWDDNATNQKETDLMMSRTLRSLTEGKTDKEAWQKLFEYNNLQNGRGKKGYVKGEKIVIKINLNPIHSIDNEWKNQGYPSPQMLNTLVRQLIEVAGVSGDDIIITDPSRYIGKEISSPILTNKSPEFSKIIFEDNTAHNSPNYRKAAPDPKAEVWFNMPDGSRYKMLLPKSYSEATYLINYTLVRPHRVFGITSVAKNHFGAVWCLDSLAFKPNPLHAFALWDYKTPNKLKDPHSAPVLMGHKIIYNKSFLYVADGLYTSVNQSVSIVRWSTFNNKWFSSLLMSQDPVALESVAYDFISSEPYLVAKNPSFNGQQDNQFQECALANNPPSGTKYDPENDGTPLKSLGVHEHWNNSTEKKYSRNLGKGIGIELIQTLMN
jgi:hypothetical protein